MLYTYQRLNHQHLLKQQVAVNRQDIAVESEEEVVAHAYVFHVT